VCLAAVRIYIYADDHAPPHLTPPGRLLRRPATAARYIALACRYLDLKLTPQAHLTDARRH
jgi:hypothetical protein